MLFKTYHALKIDCRLDVAKAVTSRDVDYSRDTCLALIVLHNRAHFLTHTLTHTVTHPSELVCPLARTVNIINESSYANITKQFIFMLKNESMIYNDML